VTAPRHELAARVIRGRIADGTLKPGRPVPSAASLAGEAGASAEAFLGAFRLLLRGGF
jgi:DNA-binding transcriptional regulator YhcF (GntR family)